MNLFKKYYPAVKKELLNYKDKTAYFPGADEAQSVLPAENSVRVLQEKLAACKWRALIEKYLELCDEEEKKFIDLLYFQGNHIIDVGIIFPLSMRACQEWREEVLKNLVLLAAGEGLIDAAGDRQCNIYS